MQYRIKEKILAAYGRDSGCEEVGRAVLGRSFVCKLLQWELATRSLEYLGTQFNCAQNTPAEQEEYFQQLLQGR